MIDKTSKRHFSPLILFVISPIVFSMLIHLGFLIFAGRIPWLSTHSSEDQTSKVVTIVEVKQRQKEEPIGDEKGTLKRPKKPIILKNVVSARPSKGAYDPGGTSKKEVVQVMTGIEETGTTSDWLRVDTAQGQGGGVGGGKGKGFPGSSTGEEKAPATFGEYIETLRGRGLDLVIVLDATSSMEAVIKEIKLKIGNLALILKRLVPSCRVGVVAYCDIGEDFVTKIMPLTYGMSSLQHFLNGIEAVGGGDVREAADEGIKAAITQMKWNRKSKALILVVGDSPPHKKDLQSTIAVISGWNKQTGGSLSVLDVRIPSKITREQWAITYEKSFDPELESFSALKDRDHILDEFQAFARAGRGEAARLSNEEKVMRNMLLYIFGSEWEAYLTEVMKNL